MQEDIRSRVEASENWRRHTFQSAIMVANDGMKSLIILNGGTFVALSALQGLAKNIDIEKLFPAILCFIVGLVCAVLAQMCSYFSISFSSYQHLHQGQAWECVWQKYQFPDDIQEIEKQRIHHECKVKKYALRTNITEYLAVIFSIFSLLLFIAGGYFGLLVFYPR
ncbi:hypothetical protein [Thalassospira sp. TSL5-1]|uniref:hypothetical protein n=1 Tax=Thalassospira sp. TSL5-1 TaxID=1544451 RepID=UPI00093FFF34|nr:hypothetical protein [Thalassospira sp. TSL5-1]OKH88115.1 hypothetical protein LF95_15720 [Thalassospira sp. TSL5-1]